MEYANIAVWRDYRSGRRWLGRLTGNEDLIRAITRMGLREHLATASVSITGRVSCWTVGTFDPLQQVYITRTEERPMEILACRGLLSTAGEQPFFHAHIVLADEAAVIGGRLFSETLAAEAECLVEELRGPSTHRIYDHRTGQLALSFDPTAPEGRVP